MVKEFHSQTPVRFSCLVDKVSADLLVLGMCINTY